MKKVDCGHFPGNRLPTEKAREPVTKSVPDSRAFSQVRAGHAAGPGHPGIISGPQGPVAG
jgi:hypothetical protein